MPSAGVATKIGQTLQRFLRVNELMDNLILTSGLRAQLQLKTITGTFKVGSVDVRKLY